MSTQITTGKVRFSYCNLFTPRAVQEGATPKYSVTLLIPKSDKATMQKIKAAMDEARAGLAKTSTEKYNAMLRTACPDGRIRGLTQFYGAARTGRWAGRLVQMQNLPQNKMPDRDLDIWYASRPIELQERMTLKATIKAHNERNGVKQTVLTRCKVVA